MSYDLNYDITVCTDCCIGIPFDWIEAHLRDNHGIRTNSEQILEQIELQVPSIEYKDVAHWLDTHSTIPIAIEGIPVTKGFGCNLCLYSAKQPASLRDHISRQHRNRDAIILDVKIQRPFGGWFKKYIQVEQEDEIEPEVEDAWQRDLNTKFANSLKINHSGGDPDTLDLRLMNAFIAKVRYLNLFIEQKLIQDGICTLKM